MANQYSFTGARRTESLGKNIIKTPIGPLILTDEEKKLLSFYGMLFGVGFISVGIGNLAHLWYMIFLGLFLLYLCKSSILSLIKYFPVVIKTIIAALPILIRALGYCLCGCIRGIRWVLCVLCKFILSILSIIISPFIFIFCAFILPLFGPAIEFIEWLFDKD